MTKRKLFLLILIFLVFEVLVWAASFVFFEDNALLVGFVLTVCGMTLLLVYVLVARLSHSAGQRPQQDSPAGASPPASPSPTPDKAGDAELDDAISSLIRDSNERLAKSMKLAARTTKRSLTELPLYFLIGPEGGGKTSLFLASKLDPELLAGQDYRDSAVVATRLGNIWFAAESVVVEAAGNLFSDGSRWSQFLRAFRRPVRELPLFKTSPATTNLSGVVLCCDTTSFTGVPDATRLSALARLTQQRLRAVGEVFGTDFPVYVVFTKADGIPYFAEYFGRMPGSQDQQLLGCSLPDAVSSGSGVHDVTETGRVSAALNRLYLSLADNRLEFLARETDRGRKPGIYEFPREFKRIRGPLVQFLVDVCRPNPLHPNPRLKGFYFTGTRKVAASASASSPNLPAELDPTMVTKVGDVTRILRAEDVERLRAQAAPSGRGEPEVTRWTFVSDLWRQIVRPGQDAAPYVDLRRQARRKAAFIAVAACGALASVLFINSFFRNLFLLRGARATAQSCKSLTQGSSPTLDNLRGIDSLRGEVQTLMASSPGVFSRFGLYQGDNLIEPARRLYFSRFNEYFLSGIVARLEADLSTLPPEQTPSRPYDSVYAALKTYRTITKSRETGCRVEPALTEKLFGMWSQDRAPDVDTEQIARASFQFFVDSLKADRVPEDFRIPSKDAPVVSRARQYLGGFRGLQPQYQHIVEQVNQEIGGPARLQDLTHDTRYRAVLRVPEEVPGAFTRAGWDRVQKLIEEAAGGAGEPCVIGSGSRLAGFLGGDSKSQLRDMYIRDYIQRWQQFLSQVSAVPSMACRDSAEKLEAFKANTSPILAVLVLAARNTTFPKHSASLTQQITSAAVTKSKGFLERFRKTKEQKSAAPGAGGSIPASGLTEDDITNTFQPVQAVFKVSPPNPEHWNDERNTPYLDALGNLQQAMQNLDQGGTCSTDAGLNNQANEQAARARGVVDQIARGFNITGVDQSIKTLLESPINDGRRWINTDPNVSLRRVIDGAQGAFCAAYGSLARKYPFSRRTEDDANPNDVARVFAPQESRFAVLKQAVGDNLSNAGGTWMPKPDAPLKLSAAFVSSFNRASQISSALFQGASPLSHYKLAVRPNPAVKQVTGLIDGIPFSMAEREYTWPSSTAKIDLRVVQSDGGSSALRSFSGPWAIFRLLPLADRISGHQFHLIFVQGVGGNSQAILPDSSPVIIEVTEFPNGVENAFDANFFQFSCPARATE